MDRKSPQSQDGAVFPRPPRPVQPGRTPATDNGLLLQHEFDVDRSLRIDIMGGQSADDHRRMDVLQALHDIEKGDPLHGPHAVRGRVGEDPIADGLELELAQKQMQRLLGVEIGALGVDQLTIDRLFGGINPIARPRLEPDLDRLSQGDVLRGQGPDVGAFGRIRRWLDRKSVV